MLSRLSFLFSLLLIPVVVADAAGVPPATDLAADARQAAAERIPLLIFFMSEACPYCQEVEALYLGPMQARGTYKGQLLMRAIEVGGRQELVDFSGQQTTHGEFARRERVYFMPVIRLYDAAGAELTPQLAGYSTPELYLGYLERAIEEAIRRARTVR